MSKNFSDITSCSGIVSNCLIIPSYNDTVSIWIGYSASNVTRNNCIELDRCGKIKYLCLFLKILILEGTAAAQWLRCCVTNRKVVGSIPAGVTGLFH